MLTLSPHAKTRMAQRAIPLEHIAAALCGRARPTHMGRIYYYDRRTRTVIVVDPACDAVITVYRAHKSQVKRMFSGWRDWNREE